MNPKRRWTFVETRVKPYEAREWAAEARRLDMSLARLVRVSVREKLAAERPRPEAEG
jgi:hypothetical protein